jgi:hypothetical protein
MALAKEEEEMTLTDRRLAVLLRAESKPGRLTYLAVGKAFRLAPPIQGKPGRFTYERLKLNAKGLK